MILLSGANTKWYAQVSGDGRVSLNPEVTNARQLLAEHYPNLVAVLDRQAEYESAIHEAAEVMRARGALSGDEAEVLLKLDRIERSINREEL